MKLGILVLGVALGAVSGLAQSQPTVSNGSTNVPDVGELQKMSARFAPRMASSAALRNTLRSGWAARMVCIA